MPTRLPLLAEVPASAGRVARFVMDDAFLAAIAKDLRHDLGVVAVAEIPAARRVAARDAIAGRGNYPDGSAGGPAATSRR